MRLEGNIKQERVGRALSRGRCEERSTGCGHTGEMRQNVSSRVPIYVEAPYISIYLCGCTRALAASVEWLLLLTVLSVYSDLFGFSRNVKT